MSVSQSYGVLRVVRGGEGWGKKRLRRRRAAVNTVEDRQENASASWLPEERFVHVVTRRETTIGRALGCDLILFEPTVSREHARLVYDEQGWQIYNLTEQNTVSVNGCLVPGGSSLPIQPQDFLLLGDMVLQLVAPQPSETQERAADGAMPLLAAESMEKAAHNGHRRDVIAEEHMLPTPLPTRRQRVLADGEVTEQEDRAYQPADTQWREQVWNEAEEQLFGGEGTMQFAFSQQLSKPTRWLMLALPVVVVMIVAVVVIVMNSRSWISVLGQDGTTSLLMTLTIPIIPALGINLLVNFIDRFEREPWFLRLAAFLWGAIIAIPPALFIEQFIDTWNKRLIGPEASTALSSLLQGLGAGVTEETVKGLGLLLLFFILRDEFDNVTDGIVYGALIGAGFAMVENFFYFGPNPSDVMLLIVGRIVLGWLCHSTFTVCFGAALGYIRHTKIRWQQIAVPLLGYVLAVSLHTCFDFINIFVGMLVSAHPKDDTIKLFSMVAIIGNYIPPFIAEIAILYFLMKSLAHEAGVIREFLVAEVRSGIVTVEEYALLPHSFARTKVERRVLHTRGIKQWLRVKALYQTEIGLAFRKWHVSMGDHPKLGYMQPEDAYRQRIQYLRQQIVEEEVARESGESR